MLGTTLSGRCPQRPGTRDALSASAGPGGGDPLRAARRRPWGHLGNGLRADLRPGGLGTGALRGVLGTTLGHRSGEICDTCIQTKGHENMLRMLN